MSAKRLGMYSASDSMLEITNTMTEDMGLGSFHKVFLALRPTIYLLYAKLEEEYGLAKRAIRIYERATEAVPPEERFEVYLFFVSFISFLADCIARKSKYQFLF
ncbi:unnamed protein product [Protopolystoma xenopodis]|uniref:Pre-mRNA-splicing factor Syf1/CRNKL1-like C-terminal HAT-repeats domain-containing protein n=1 Tax=Protopolystoma xenopodis TaxID=117903 RepID=A0A448XND5_9PLAT|nr:unnamed protein product [Protopolystoma xenopodis]